MTMKTKKELERARNPDLVCFETVNTVETYEEIIEYNTILDRVEKVDGGRL